MTKLENKIHKKLAAAAVHATWVFPCEVTPEACLESKDGFTTLELLDMVIRGFKEGETMRRRVKNLLD